MKDLLDRLSKGSLSQFKSLVDQILKGHYLSLPTLTLVTQDNANLRAANGKIVKKRNLLTK
jgi:hypothetical protein